MDNVTNNKQRQVSGKAPSDQHRTLNKGEGRAYSLALEALKLNSAHNEFRESDWHINLLTALHIFERATFTCFRAGEPNNPPAILHSVFDIDSVISFSDAWPYWEALNEFIEAAQRPVPLDQRLFRRQHAQAEVYFQGIESLAHKYAPRVAGWLRTHLPKVPVSSLIDLGAGPGVYARTLINEGVVQHATCVDFERAELNDKRVSWVTSDLFELFLPGLQGFDIIYIGNVLHHYSAPDNVRLLRRLQNHVTSGSYLVVQEYLIPDGSSDPPIYSSILGVHFALTSAGGRCYSAREISSMVNKSLPGLTHIVTENLGATDILVYKAE
jgi:hypothetical protein